MHGKWNKSNDFGERLNIIEHRYFFKDVKTSFKMINELENEFDDKQKGLNEVRNLDNKYKMGFRDYIHLGSYGFGAFIGIMAIGAVGLSGLMGVELNYHPIDRTVALIRGKSFEEHWKEISENRKKAGEDRIRNDIVSFFEKYDINKDGSVSREEYFTVINEH